MRNKGWEWRPGDLMAGMTRAAVVLLLVVGVVDVVVAVLRG